MALTTIDTNNKLIKFTQEINREFARENLFSPYMGEDLTSIIRVRNDLKSGGETINLPIVSRLRNSAVGSGTLVGAEEKIDNYGQRVRVDWARNAVVSNQAENQKDSADIFGEAKSLLSDWGKELQRDEIIAALMALPTETLPGTDVRVNGTLYQTATAGQLNTWMTDNRDRVLYGGATANAVSGVHTTALALVTQATGKAGASFLSLLKRVAMNAVPKIRPFKTRDGYEYYVAFMGTNPFRDVKLDTLIASANTNARAREGNGMDRNPIFQDGDQLWDGIIVRCVPEITSFVSNVWGTGTGQLLTSGGSSTRVEPVFLCGQQAAAFCWGSMAKPTFRKEDDYQFITGTGIQMCYGVSKIFKKHPNTGTALVQFGMATGFASALADYVLTDLSKGDLRCPQPVAPLSTIILSSSTAVMHLTVSARCARP